MVRQRLDQFLFPEKSGDWITILRIGLGLVVTLYCLSLWNDWNYLFSASSSALINRELTEAILNLESSWVPKLSWLVGLFGYAGVSEETTLAIARAGLLAGGLCLLAGFCCRSTAAATWLLHLALRSSGGYTAYGVDNFMTIGLFYLTLSPLPDRFSLDARFWRGPEQDPRRNGFHLRVLQVHLCLIYFFGGLAKCLGSGWWDGSSIWRALTRSPFNVISPEILVQGSYFLPPIGIFICLLEFGYPLLIWPKKTRTFCLSAILAMHIGIGITMGLYLFVLVMIVLNLSAFGSDLFALGKRRRPATGNAAISSPGSGVAFDLDPPGKDYDTPLRSKESA